MPGNISQYQVVIAGQIIAASLWNGMENNIINNGLIPSGIDDYSATDSEMQTQTDPYPAGTTSRPTSLQGELERLRFQFKNITGETYWYEDPDTTLASAATNITALQAKFPVVTADITDSNVTTAKIADSNVTTAKIADSNVTTAKIAAAAVDETKLAASIAGSGLAGGAGTALSVNVDSSTIEINSDTLRVKDGGITGTKIASATITSANLASSVPAAVGMKSIQSFTVSATVTNGLQTKVTNQTISSVDTSKSVVVLNLVSLVGGTLSIQGYSLTLTTSTNLAVSLTLTSTSSGTTTYSIGVTILEFN